MTPLPGELLNKLHAPGNDVRTITITWDGEAISTALDGCRDMVETIGMLECAKVQILAHKDPS
jgi:hypothetical protein